MPSYCTFLDNVCDKSVALFNSFCNWSRITCPWWDVFSESNKINKKQNRFDIKDSLGISVILLRCIVYLKVAIHLITYCITVDLLRIIIILFWHDIYFHLQYNRLIANYQHTKSRLYGKALGPLPFCLLRCAFQLQIWPFTSMICCKEVWYVVLTLWRLL